MAHDDVPTTEPTELTSGASWRWNRTLPDHPPSDGWTLKYAIRGPTDSDLTATANGETYEVRATLASSGSALPGVYRLVGYVERGVAPDNEREIVYDASLLVHASPFDGVNSAGHAAETLALLEAAIEGRIPDGKESFQINGTQISRIPLEQLVRLRGYYAGIVKRRRHPGRIGQTVEVVFAPPA